MTVPTRIAGLLAVSLLAVVGLTACVPAAPTPTPTKTSVAATPKPAKSATPTPTPSVAPVAARVQIDGTSITVMAADNSVILDVPFTTDPATAAAQLTSAIGAEPAVTTTANGLCAVDTTHYAWGGLWINVPGGFAAAPGATFIASVRDATTSNGLPVGMPSGQGVGAATTDVLAANPGVPVEGEPAGDSVVYFDVLSGHPLGDMDSFYGAEALAIGGVITSLVSPIHYYYDC
ncbi:MAG: hypothetical protein ABI632_06440 [Pseudolysinimonas sp.]